MSDDNLPPESAKNAKSKAKKEGKKLEIRVCFDTNAIHNDSALYFLPIAVKELIERHSKHYDVSLTWYIPQMARGEREFRMRAVADRLLPKVKDLETLFGVGLNITQGNIAERISVRIDKEMSDRGIRTLACDAGRIGWDRVFTDAVFRRPPFESSLGEKEKGFRDLVVGEAFLQLVEDSPRGKKTCQIVLVTNDSLLRDMVHPRLTEFDNARVVPDLASLEELVNTLVSDATEEYVNSLRDDAGTFFLADAQAKTGLYFSDRGQSEVTNYLVGLARKVPAGAEEVRLGPLTLSAPSFVSKDRQRIKWVSRITVALQAFKQERYLDVGGTQRSYLGRALGNFGLGAPSGISTTIGDVSPASTPGLLTIASGNPPASLPTFVAKGADLWKTRERIIYDGQAEIDIHWEVTVTTQLRLTNGTITGFNVTEPEWKEAQTV